MTHSGELLNHLARLAIHTLPRVRLVATGLDCTIFTFCVPAIVTTVFSMRMVCMFSSLVSSQPLRIYRLSTLRDGLRCWITTFRRVRMQKAPRIF